MYAKKCYANKSAKLREKSNDRVYNRSYKYLPFPKLWEWDLWQRWKIKKRHIA